MHDFFPSVESSKGGGSFLNSVAEKKGQRVQDVLAIAGCKVAKLSLKKYVCNVFFLVLEVKVHFLIFFFTVAS